MRARIGAAVLLAVAPLAACASPGGTSGTTGRTIELQTRVELAADPTQPKTNAHGWNVSLTKGYLSIGALYYYSGDPVLTRRVNPRQVSRSVYARVQELIVGTAHAHPGHYVEGAAMGQMLQPTTVDLLAGPVVLGVGDGVTGETNSARFTWHSPPKGELSALLEGHVLWTMGMASKDGNTVRFIAKVDGADVRDGNGKAEVAGCAFGSEPGQVGVEMSENGTVTLVIVPSVWFDQVDFAYVLPTTANPPTPDADGYVDLAGTLAWQGFVRGVKKGTAYRFAYSRGFER